MKALPALAALALLQPTLAHAGAPCAGAPCAGEWGGLFSFIALTSDYRFQGVSNTDGNAAVQGNLHYWRPDGFYAGAFVSQVDFKDPGQTSYEVDWYGGKNLEFAKGATEWKLQAMYSAFPDNHTFGPTYDFLTLSTAVKHTAGKLTTNTLAAFVPEGSYRSGKVWRIEQGADYALRPNLTLKGPRRPTVGRTRPRARLLEPGRGGDLEDADLRPALCRHRPHAGQLRLPPEDLRPDRGRHAHRQPAADPLGHGNPSKPASAGEDVAERIFGEGDPAGRLLHGPRAPPR